MINSTQSAINLYDFSTDCLISQNEALRDLETVDNLQYVCSVLMFFITIPIVFTTVFLIVGDNIRYCCYPLLLINVLFGCAFVILS